MQHSPPPSLRTQRARPVGVQRRPALEAADALLAWKEAEAIAWEAERCLYAAWYAYRSSGLAVPALLQHRATTTRALARQKLDQAIAASKWAAAGPGAAWRTSSVAARRTPLPTLHLAAIEATGPAALLRQHRGLHLMPLVLEPEEARVAAQTHIDGAERRRAFRAQRDAKG